MRFTTTLAAATAIALTSTTAFAGGVAPVIIEPVEVMEEPATSSVKPAYIVLGVLAALLIASQIDDDDDEEDDVILN
ncbi:hypothetical protein [Yoonia sp. I 8.24]|uniref:hypothetical protein n=1 Tax=Yoonia sp. I 8.24 TaxID=1537229 RepID=UPI001EDCA091|nr:hypothetical protein [Yoonia sp. I 8.24]MCG3269611.1 hypothetical protein [Yoonia sp. I 8.24]